MNASRPVVRRATPDQALADDAPFARRDLVLYAITVLSWSASWYVLKVNASYSVSAPVTTCWRFLLAAIAMFVLVVFTGGRLRFGWRMHGAFALLGMLLFSTSFIAFYHASTMLVSGLLAVVFSLASVLNLLIAALRGDRAGPRRWFGAALGASGIVLLYGPALGEGGAGAFGLALCLGGTLSFCLGNQLSQALGRQALPVMSASAWGMLYGAIWCAMLAVLGGYPFVYDTAPGYTASLLFLAIVSTVLAFWAYLNLVRRIGAGRASYATVMFPIFALLLSTLVEGYAWTGLAVLGVTLALAGNLFVLRSAHRHRAAVPNPVV